MISIRRFSDDDFNIVREFYVKAFEGDMVKKMKAFKWMQTRNPFFDPINNYALIFFDEKLSAYWGVMPVKFYHFGKPFFALFSQEALVDPFYRRQGLATKLINEVNQCGHFLVSLWHNERIVAMLKKSGWSNIGNFRPLKKIYKLENIIRIKIGNRFFQEALIYLVKPFFKIRLYRNKTINDCNIEFVEKCGAEFDHLFMCVAPKLGILSDRGSATLNWKYLDIPYKKYIFLAARKKGKLCGYAVLRIENQEMNIRKGIIVDVLVKPDEPEALACLVNKCDEIFSNKEVDFSVCIVQKETFRNVFKRQGYYRAKSRSANSLWIYNDNKSPDREAVKNIKNWYFTYGESDGDMW